MNHAVTYVSVITLGHIMSQLLKKTFIVFTLVDRHLIEHVVIKNCFSSARPIERSGKSDVTNDGWKITPS